MLVCVGNCSVARTVDDVLKEEADVDATSNMLHRHPSINESLVLYSHS